MTCATRKGLDLAEWQLETHLASHPNDEYALRGLPVHDAESESARVAEADCLCIEIAIREWESGIDLTSFMEGLLVGCGFQKGFSAKQRAH